MPMYGVKNSSTSRNQNDFNIDFKHEADQNPDQRAARNRSRKWLLSVSDNDDDDGNSVVIFIFIGRSVGHFLKIVLTMDFWLLIEV